MSSSLHRLMILAALTFASLRCVHGARIPFPSRAHDPEDDDTLYDDEDAFDEDDDPEPFWADLASKLQRNLDSESLLRARRYGNIVNGVLLGATGPVTFLVSLFSMRLSSAVLSVYLTAMGATLAALELGFSPVSSWVSDNLSYLSKPRGKTSLLAIAGGLTWTFGKAGLLPAILTCANALFNVYFTQVLHFVSDDDLEAACDSAPEEQLPADDVREVDAASTFRPSSSIPSAGVSEHAGSTPEVEPTRTYASDAAATGAGAIPSTHDDSVAADVLSDEEAIAQLESVRAGAARAAMARGGLRNSRASTDDEGVPIGAEQQEAE
mmetsp:Transcript_22345/g.48226  ORF Transcript_22345/g.48226 Transcript_22345/m.48226 type:complete len:324 (-) Transcript_22345:222-1193(-)|eukprot:CAMPEP_0183352494 /NCGR_PEP_ID=MMETSP0164_2-20130417/29476_1 /TAXON_ID=221442 /ORGANISM="Coccolithus pelagicus ssp braarudi, Strain PLY182g" /LENGTH=323 /DNA_ID=CAMNT_0025524941 /DNA_START=23 /DNA_END=994 /DNA_ORIENTATION=-